MTDAILGTFVKIGTMADGTPRIVLDLQCSLSEVAAMGLIPGVPFGLARINKESSTTQPVSQPDAPKQKPGELCVMACTFCDDPLFLNWINTETSDVVRDSLDAKGFILFRCDIDSRKKLDTNKHAADIFHRQIREPFLKWKRKQ